MFKSIKPPQHLKNYIDCFWLGDDSDLGEDQPSHHSIASSKMEMLFFCRGIYSDTDDYGNSRPLHKAGLYGHTTHYRQYFGSALRTTIFGIKFFPLAAVSLFHLPASELTNIRVNITDILKTDDQEFIDEILEAPSFEEKVSLAIHFFTPRCKPLDIKYRSVLSVIHEMQQPGSPSIPQLVAGSCLSARQFERHFKTLTGFSARTYLKLIRFEKMIRSGFSSSGHDDRRYINMATELGYFDQAHFNRHFKEFTGINPGAYYSRLHLSAGH